MAFFRSAARRRLFYILGALLLLSQFVHHAHAGGLAAQAAPLFKVALSTIGG